MNALEILYCFYPEDTPLRRLLLRHSHQVRAKALAIRLKAGVPETDPQLVSGGALLHDIGILRCHAPSIFCTGPEPYLAHGQIGGRMLRSFGRERGWDLEAYARICERHTGAGIRADDVRRQSLPIPAQDWLPETTEEKLICFADKFFSKSGDGEEKTMAQVLKSLSRFGPETLERFAEMRDLFHF